MFFDFWTLNVSLHYLHEFLLSFRHPRCALQVTDFSTSWSDGKAFCAVIYAYNAETFSYSEVEGEEPVRRLEYAFKFAEETVLVERLLDVEGMFCTLCWLVACYMLLL